MKSIISGIIVALLLMGMLTLAFNVLPTRAQSGSINIMPDGSIIPSNANITTSDRVTYTFTGNNYLPIIVNRNNIIINGMGHTLRAPGNYGFYLSGVNNVTIKNTTITNSSIGFTFFSSSGNVLYGNNITANLYAGFIWGSHNNTFSDNNIAANLYAGIALNSSFGNVFSGNNIRANGYARPGPCYGEYGVAIWSSDNNTFSDNNFTANNWQGIWLTAYSMSAPPSSGDIFYHNNFINNTQQVSGEPFGIGAPNTWDNGYPSGGNYWSDYRTRYPNATEIDNSGVWNTSYVVDVNNTDRYPLMKPFSVPLPLTYTLTITTSVGGTTNPAPGTYSHIANSSLKVTATPEAGYSFDYWELDSANAGSVNPYTVLLISNHTLKAIFVQIIYQLTIQTTTGGTTSPSLRTYNYTFNSSIQVVAIPNANYLFDHWELDSFNVGSLNPYTVLMNENHTLIAIFSYVKPSAPVGGYSIPIRVPTSTNTLATYIILTVILATAFTTIKRKRRKTQ